MGVNSYTYDEDDNITGEEIRSESTSNGYEIEYLYSTDSFKQLNEIIYSFGMSSPIRKTYTYDTVYQNGKDNYTGRVDNIKYTGIYHTTIECFYTYDSNGLITIVEECINDSLIYKEENEYDIFGRLTKQNITTENPNLKNQINTEKYRATAKAVAPVVCHSPSGT